MMRHRPRSGIATLSTRQDDSPSQAAGRRKGSMPGVRARELERHLFRASGAKLSSQIAIATDRVPACAGSNRRSAIALSVWM